jgi:hypothetical protein
MWNIHVLVAGDFTLKLDVEHNCKPRSSTIVKDFMEDFNLNDEGGEMRIHMWRHRIFPKVAADWIIFI